MDDMRNRGYSAFPRMPHWLAEDDPQMLDLASRMSHAPNWPLSMGRRGGPWRDRRNSGGSAMSATSEDDSSYDHPHNDKSSQGSGGSGGLDAAIGHEIPIMIEAEAPPSMMPPPQQPQQQQNAPQQPHPQTSGMSGPEPPCVGQVRKSPQYATRTSSATDDVSGAHREQQRATRCSSAPPSMIDQRGNGTGRQAQQANKGSGAPQTRSATVPINPHNNVAKPFVSAFKNNSPRSQDPIMEESMQQQQQRPNSRHSSPAPQQQQQQYSGQNFQQLPAGNHHQQHASQNYPQQQDQNYQQHPQQQYYEQDPLYYGQQQWPNQGFFQQYPDYGGPWQQFYSNDPRMYEQERHYAPQQQQQQQPPLQHQRPSVVRTIPIYIEGQERPIVNENEASSLSSSPRAAPQLTRNQQQQPQRQQQQPQRQQPQHQPQPPPWQSQQPKLRQTFQPQFRQHFPQDRPAENAFQQFFNNDHPSRNQETQRPYYPEQQFYQQQQAAPPQQEQQFYQQQRPYTQQQQQHYGSQEIPIATQRESSPHPPPPPPPPPVKLTPLEKIEQVRSKTEEFMQKVDAFTGTKKDREFLYLDEMLTRALISLDDIDPDGNAEIRQARKNLIKDINSKISLLEKKASAGSAAAAEEKSPAPPTEYGDPAAVGVTDSAKETSPSLAGPSQESASKDPDNTKCDVAPTAYDSLTSEENKSSTAPADDKPSESTAATETNNNTNDVSGNSGSVTDGALKDAVVTEEKEDVIKEPIPCPAPAIPLPEK
ncbi:putative mediator of RNA polymerase II transcription subunit 12 [Hyalella azteca]|nr:putative mediator of RNA polymerase II transcription subunit 12 [Hyalella azteca]